MNYQEIIETFINGNVTDALEAIEQGGVAVCAMVLVQGVEEGLLPRSEAFRIANTLIQRQVDRNGG